MDAKIFVQGDMVRIIKGPFSTIDNSCGRIIDILRDCTYCILVEVEGPHGPTRVNFSIDELHVI